MSIYLTVLFYIKVSEIKFTAAHMRKIKCDVCRRQTQKTTTLKHAHN